VHLLASQPYPNWLISGDNAWQLMRRHARRGSMSLPGIAVLLRRASYIAAGS